MERMGSQNWAQKSQKADARTPTQRPMTALSKFTSDSDHRGLFSHPHAGVKHRSWPHTSPAFISIAALRIQVLGSRTPHASASRVQLPMRRARVNNVYGLPVWNLWHTDD